MVQRHKLTAAFIVAASAICSCSVKVAATGSTGSFDATNLGGHQRRPTASPSDTAQQLKDQATALHRAGEYEEAAAEFARAAEVLEGSAGGPSPSSVPALSAIRLSLAAAQLKSGDVQGAEFTCSQLLRTPGLARLLRQKAYYRRAMARRRQLDAAGMGEAGSQLTLKAYRDAYLSVKLSQDGGGAGPAEGDAKAVGLLAEIDSGPGGGGRLTEADRAAAQSKADKHLASLTRAAVSQSAAPSGGMFDMLGGAGGASSGLGGVPGLGGGNGGMGGMPGLMDMMGAGAGAGGGGGGGGTEGMGELMSMVMGGAGGAGGDTAAGGPDKKQMLKMAKKMSKVVKKQLRTPSTQLFVCSFLKQAEPATLKSMAGAAGMPLNDGIIDGVSKYLKKADGKTLESWVDYGEIASGLYRRVSQLTVLFSRGVALAGVWLVWVWLRACFAPIILTTAKA